jgi:hypothetical protein
VTYFAQSDGISVAPAMLKDREGRATGQVLVEHAEFKSRLSEDGSDLFYRIGTRVDLALSLGFASGTLGGNDDPARYSLKSERLYFWSLAPPISLEDGRHRLQRAGGGLTALGLYLVAGSWLAAHTSESRFLGEPGLSHFLFADRELTLEFVVSNPIEDGLRDFEVEDEVD